MSRLRPFVGRVAQLAALEEALATAILGRGSAVVLCGEPGIGKTRLAGELSERAERRGARVLWARCAAESQAPPYWPFAQLLEPLYGDQDPAHLQERFGPGAHDAAQLFLRRFSVQAAGGDSESTRAPLSDQQRFRLFDTVTAMLLAAAAKRPLVLVFDDIHAADPACLHLLVFLARSLRSSAVLVVGTLRDAESRREDVAPILLGSLAREASTLGLDGWNRDEVGAFLAHDGNHVAAAPVIDAVHRASAGNPFFVGEIARLLAGDTRPAGAEPIPVPAHVRQAVLARLDDSPARVRTAMRAASILGLCFDTRTVATVCGLAADETAAALAEAVTAGFLERRGDGAWCFRHEIARDVLYETGDAASRRQGHLLAASGMSRSGDASESVAHHLLAALPDGHLDDALVAVLAAAEAAVRAMAYESAVRWLRRGLAALVEHGAATDAAAASHRRQLHGQLLLRLGDAAWTAGDHASSRAAYEDAAVLAGSRNGNEDVVDSQLLARAALGLGGRQQRAHVQFDARVVELLESAITAVGGEHPALLARLEARLAYALYAAPNSRPERESLCRDAVERARNIGDPETLAWVLADRRWALWGPATLGERRESGEELLAAAHRRGDREAVLVEQGWRMVDALELGDRPAMDEAFAAYRGMAAGLRLPWYEWYATRLACLVAQLEGRTDDAERLAAEALAAGERAGHPDAALSFGSQMLGVRMAQDRAVELEAGIEMSIAQYPDVLLWRRLLARLRVAQGREAEAMAEVERARRGPLVEAPGDFLHLPSLVILAELVAAIGDQEVLELVHEALQPFAGRQVVLGFGMAFLGPVDQYLGELDAAAGRPQEARGRFERAAAQAAGLGAARWAARARLGLRNVSAPRTFAAAPPLPAGPPAASRPRAVLEADGNGWRGEFAGAGFRVGPLRGLLYLRALLAVPEREIHVLELAALGDTKARGEPGAAALSDRADTSDAGPLLDDKAKRAYRTRLAELQEDLQQAADFADNGRIALVRAEIEALEEELSRAIGLRGRDRRAGAAAERARVAVAKRIRGALERLGEQSPELQRYLEATVRTGVFCVYRPDPGRPVDWELGSDGN